MLNYFSNGFCSARLILAGAERGASRKFKLIGIWFLARPHVLSATRVKKNCFSLSFIALFCQTWRRASTGEFCRFSGGVRPPQGRVGGRWRLWRAVRVEIAQPGSRLSPDPGAESPPPGKAP